MAGRGKVFGYGQKRIVFLLVLLLLLLFSLFFFPLRFISPPPPREEGEVLGDIPIAVYLPGREPLRLGLEEYVAGVVAAEMPLSFPLEALKAQAVAARSYAVRRMRLFGGEGCPDHPRADACGDYRRGQAWISREEMRRRWGWTFPFRWWRLERAVRETRGLVLVHSGEVADALYHAHAGGRTEAAEEVFGKPVPYLVGVPSPGEGGRWELTRWSFSRRELSRRLGVALVEAGRVEVVARSSSGRALKVRVGSREFAGREVRERLGLPSTLFTVERRGEEVVFSVRGYGHGVGMSQYGAAALARKGSDFRAILGHYYPGTRVRPLFLE
jgi:stage II sporulation protein D